MTSARLVPCRFPSPELVLIILGDVVGAACTLPSNHRGLVNGAAVLNLNRPKSCVMLMERDAHGNFAEYNPQNAGQLRRGDEGRLDRLLRHDRNHVEDMAAKFNVSFDLNVRESGQCNATVESFREELPRRVLSDRERR